MSGEQQYIEFNFMLDPGEDGSNEEALDRILYLFVEAVEAEGWSCGGSVGPSPPEDRICQRCDGVGIADPIPDERKCPTCDGTGEVDPDSMTKEEWDELYGT